MYIHFSLYRRRKMIVKYRSYERIKMIRILIFYIEINSFRFIVYGLLNSGRIFRIVDNKQHRALETGLIFYVSHPKM